MSRHSDTIFALSSGSLPAGVAVVRVSGRHAATALQTMTGSLPAPRIARYTPIRDLHGEMIDRGLVLWLPGPASFTGEDCVEFHLHGGRAVVKALVVALGDLTGLRPAEPGEFSRRAFLNDKLDLTSLEGLADLIAAETDLQRRLALRQAGGAARVVLDGWRSRLIRMRALIEADLDFPDEDDVPGSVSAAVWPEAASLAAEMRRHLASADRGERARSGLEVALMGPPNAGKSSLLNALAGREAAIVTPEAGTTRDPIEVRLDLGGYPVTLVDTAGLRTAEGAIEAEGIRRARQRGEAADLVLWLSSLDEPAEIALAKTVWRVATKVDLAEGGAEQRGAGHRISVVTGEGLGELEAALARFAADAIGGAEDIVITRARHRDGLASAVHHLETALRSEDLGIELRAEDLRAASDALGRLTGRVDVEDLLDVIFRDFCIGK